MKPALLPFYFFFALSLGPVAHAFQSSVVADPAKDGAVFARWQKGLNDIVSGSQANLRSLKERIEKDEDSIMGLELMIASPVPGSLISGFGHAMLRFVDRSGDWSQDYVLSFAALVDEPDISLIKGLDGGYRVLPMVRTLLDFWGEYSRGEGRDLDRYIVPTTAKMRRNLIERLVYWTEHSDEYLSEYTFLNKNCAGLLTELMGEAGIGNLDDIRTRLPTHLADTFLQNWITVYPVLKVGSVQPTLQSAATVLGISIENLKSGKDWPADAASTLEKMPVRDNMVLLDELLMIPEPVRKALVARVKEAPLSNEELLEIKPVPPELYQLCKTNDCAAKALDFSRSIWSAEELGLYEEKRLELLKTLKFIPEMWDFYEHLLKLTVVAELRKQDR